MHSLARDDADEVPVAWRDERAGSALYAQHLTGDGTALWTADGQWVDSFGHWPSILADWGGRCLRCLGDPEPRIHRRPAPRCGGAPRGATATCLHRATRRASCSMVSEA